MNIDIETIEVMEGLRRAINSTSLSEINLYVKGERVELPIEEVEEFLYTGLSNIDFFTMRNWEV